MADDARLSYVVGRLDRVLRRRLGAMLRPFGLTLAQYTALSVLRGGRELSNAQLARRTLVTPQSMNEVLVALERRELIRRERDPADARRWRAELTGEGTRVLAACDAELARVEEAMLADLPRPERTRLLHELEACVRRLES